MDAFTIRDMTEGDIADAVRIATTAWMPIFKSYFELLGDRLYNQIHPDWKKEKERQIRESAASGSPVTFVVAESAGRIAGFASYLIHSNAIGEIANNAVDPEFQNRGIASSLYAEILSRLKREGASCVMVTTGLDSSHEPARRAYQKAGFARSFPSITYYKNLESA